MIIGTRTINGFKLLMVADVAGLVPNGNRAFHTTKGTVDTLRGT
jgi:hypothetical protein